MDVNHFWLCVVLLLVMIALGRYLDRLRVWLRERRRRQLGLSPDGPEGGTSGGRSGKTDTTLTGQETALATGSDGYDPADSDSLDFDSGGGCDIDIGD